MKEKKKYKYAIGYARVSTSEQKKFGNSLKNQVDSINNFCERNGIILMKSFEEDASAANFNRPKFKELLAYIQKYKGEIDVLLIDKHDRFSRNIEEALTMTRKLEQIGVEVNYVSEWQDDINSSDSKIMRALRFTLAEVEREKIRQRTAMGTRASLVDGRYTKTPPLGFKRDKDEEGKSSISPNEKASLVKELFYDYSLGIYTQKDLIKKYKGKGLILSRSVLSRMLENVLYMGYIDLKRHNIEPYKLIKAKHKAIVTKELFDKVQLIKTAKNSKKKAPRQVNENFPLTSFIICAKCNKPFYGSNSNNGKKKKNTKYYFYYECKSNCNCNESYRTHIVHSEFNKVLQKIKPSEDSIEAFKHILIDEYKKHSSERLEAIKQINRSLEELDKNETSLTEKYIAGKIKEDMFEKISKKHKHQELELKQRKKELGDFQGDVDKLLSFGITMISNIDQLYELSPIKLKRKILGSNFTDNPTFSNGKFRTLPFNEAILLMSSYNKDLRAGGNKKGTNSKISSHSVLEAGIEPALPKELDFESNVSTSSTTRAV